MAKERLAVYTVIRSLDDEKKDYWQRVGSAFVNKDGSLNVRLNALPVNGSLHIREENQKSDQN